MNETAELEEEVTEELETEEKPVEDELESEEDEDELEEWQKENAEADDPDPDYQVDGKLHQDMKTKLKGRVSDRDEEIERLKAENEKLKVVKPVEQPTTLVRPKEDDFDTTEEYDTALDKYNDDRLTETANRNQLARDQGDAMAKAGADLKEAVDGHYGRAEKLVESSGIKPEIYQAADATVRKAVEDIKPNQGDIIVDQVISIMGEGSEKVLYYLGRNKAALNKFQALLSSDPSGMKAAVYLGQEKQRLTNPKKPRSQAPDPAPDAGGDENVSGNEKAMKKKYDAASKKDNPQAMYDAKKAARKAGIDVSKW